MAAFLVSMVLPLVDGLGRHFGLGFDGGGLLPPGLFGRGRFFRRLDGGDGFEWRRDRLRIPPELFCGLHGRRCRSLFDGEGRRGRLPLHGG